VKCAAGLGMHVDMTAYVSNMSSCQHGNSEIYRCIFTKFDGYE